MKKHKLLDSELEECKLLKKIYLNKKKELGLSQYKLADELGISQGAVNHYLNGINALNVSVASEFARLLKVPVSDFSWRLAKDIEEMSSSLGIQNTTTADTVDVKNNIGNNQYKKIEDIRLENLKLLIEEVGNVPELAKRVGYSQPSYIYQIVNKSAIQNGKPKNIGNNMAGKLEQAMGKPKGWMDTEHHKSKIIDVSQDKSLFMPYLKETAFHGGDGTFEIPDYNGFRLPFGRSTLYKKGIQPDNVFCCTLTGDSMEERIAEDASIAVDTGAITIKDGKIYAFRHDDMFRVKYLHRLPGGKIKIKSHNSFYEDEEVDVEAIQVIGRVFWWSVLD